MTIATAKDFGNSKHQFINCYASAVMAGMDINELRRLNLENLAGGFSSYAEMGRRGGIDPTYISQMINGHRKIGEKSARNLELKLGMPTGWLDQDHSQDMEKNFEAPARPPGKVPLISWVQAGDYKAVIDNLAPGDAEEWIGTEAPVRKHTYALRVVGDSMEPEFPEGSIIIVEPTLLADPGNYVIVRNGEHEATFKQLIRDGADWLLKPVNPRYPIKPMPRDAQVVGVVRERQSIKKYR